MSWLLVALGAYFLAAISVVVDKTLLKKDIPNPIVYTFYIAAFGAIPILILLPFFFSFPSPLIILVALMAGISFVWALILMYYGLRREEASRLAPMIGGLTPIFVF